MDFSDRSSPCLHAPQRSCLKHEENTLIPRIRGWNPAVWRDALTTFQEVIDLREKGQVSLCRLLAVKGQAAV